MGKRLLLILNPISGKMTGKKHLADVLGKFCAADYEPMVFITGAAGDAIRYAARWGGDVDLVVAMGGDGTFTEVVTGLLQEGHRPQMGYIPCGSTNDFASAIGLKKTIPAATDAILGGTPHTYDVGLFGERPFLTWLLAACSPAPLMPPLRT
ncbi:MAG: acylglycerol kinase family protein [Clostridia bacterium]|nr:acylglycerol kinase family protein [Clostridia bacterium]